MQGVLIRLGRVMQKGAGTLLDDLGIARDAGEDDAPFGLLIRPDDKRILPREEELPVRRPF